MLENVREDDAVELAKAGWNCEDGAGFGCKARRCANLLDTSWRRIDAVQVLEAPVLKLAQQAASRTTEIKNAGIPARKGVGNGGGGGF
jgi:hypothetical protein